MKPKWQKARIISGLYKDRELWCEVGPPQQHTPTVGAYSVKANTGRRELNPSSFIGYHMAINDTDGRLGFVVAGQVELLSRNANDFANDVPIQTLDEWLEKGLLS